MRVLVLSALLVLAHARPQEFTSDSEVELVPAVSTNEDEGGSGGPIVVILRGGPPSTQGFGGFPFGSPPGFSGFPFQAFGDDSLGDLPDLGDLDDVFETRVKSVKDGEEVEEDDHPGVCGPLCTMFKILQGLRGGIHSMIEERHGAGTPSIFDNTYDVNNSTYEEKVLPDGTLVKINRTVMSDADGFGNHFFFQSTFSHNFGSLDESYDEEDGAAEESVEFTPPELEAEAELIESFDPSLNEIEDVFLPKEFPTSDVSGVDDGLEK